MAVGDVVSALSSIAASGTFTIQPTAGVEWVIHTVDLSYSFGMRLKSSTLTASIETWQAGHWALTPGWHLTNSVYVEFINTDTVAGHPIGYTGIQTK